MMRRLRTLRGCERGATLVEFAFVAPVMMLMLSGGFDLAHMAYAKAVLEGTVDKAGRDSTLETGASVTAGAAMDQAILEKVRSVTGPDATYTVERDSYTDFGDVEQPERLIDAAPFNGVHDTGECFEDENANGQWDADMGRAGQGGANDVVLYRLTITYPRLFPMAGLLGWSPNQSISAATILRNQPYSNQQRAPVVRCP